MKKGTTIRMIIMLVVAGLILGGVVGFQTFKNKMIEKSIKGQGIPPQTVSTIVAEESVWQPSIEAMGSLRSGQQANLSTEAGGLVTAIHFMSGDKVKAGTPLIELNPAPLQAQLAQIEAQIELAQTNLKRDQAQLKIQAVSQAVVDTDAANLKGLQAQAAAQKALIAQKLIRAPFSGQLGIRQVDLGQYLSPGAVIASLQELDRMEIDFTVPQSQIDLIHVGMTADVTTSALPSKTFQATVAAIEPQIDPATRNMKVRARLPNPKGELLPGVFGTVRITEGKPRNYITLPNAAVAFNPYGATVFVIEPEGKDKDGKPKLVAKQRFVTTGLTRGDQVAIVEGVKPGETVVTAGQLKLRNGSPVLINNSVQPANEAHPQVPNS